MTTGPAPAFFTKSYNSFAQPLAKLLFLRGQIPPKEGNALDNSAPGRSRKGKPWRRKIGCARAPSAPKTPATFCSSTTTSCETRRRSDRVNGGTAVDSQRSNTYIYIYISIYLSIYLSLSLYIYLSLSIYIYIYTYTCRYVHTCSHHSHGGSSAWIAQGSPAYP